RRPGALRRPHLEQKLRRRRPARAQEIVEAALRQWLKANGFVEGKLLGPWVTELTRSCNELACSPDCLRLDLTAVTFVDGAGLALLRDLLARGATLAACSGLVAQLLHGGRR